MVTVSAANLIFQYELEACAHFFQLWERMLRRIQTIYFFTQFPVSLFDNFILINYQVYYIQVSTLYISIFCLLLYRRILTRSQTNCLKYFLIYLLTTLICLVTVMVNIRYLGILFILTEVLSVSFHLLL